MPSVRWLAAVAVAGFLLVGCGQSNDGVLIGVRTQPDVASVVATFDSSTITAQIDAQLAAYDQLAPIQDSVRGELPLDSTLTLNQRQRLATLQQLGFAYVTDRLTLLDGLRSQVTSDPSMLDWQKANVTGLLDPASSSLSQLRLKIEQALLVAQARVYKAQVLKLRIDVVLVPEARLLIVGYQLQRLAVLYTRQQATLQGQINTAQANGKDVTVARAAATAMTSMINAINQDSAAGLAQLSGLTAAGYPGNKHLLLSARSALGAGKYASNQAAADVARARAALGL